jgi:uncharacterized cupredoxin-like copper-binding protein
LKLIQHLRALSVSTALVSLAVTSLAVRAHGNEDHVKKAAPVKLEQKAWGIAAEAKATNAAPRVIAIRMTDAMRFTPNFIQVKLGETVKFVIKNDGQMLHEFVLGTKAELDEHAAQMLKFPGMEHDEPYMAHVPAGKSGEIIWTFNRAGDFDFACLIAGHYQAGMLGKVKVSLLTPLAVAEASAAPVAPVVASADFSDGEIRKVDKDTQRLTIKHGAIKNLDMPGMTMLFRVKDPALLDKVKPGDKVKFKAESVGGAILVTEIQVAE